MTDEVLTAANLAMAGSTWFLAKVTEPSAKAIGETMQQYLGQRMPRIFGLAADRAQAAGIEPKPIPPGLLTRMVIDASVSEESDDLDSWWANLFLDASWAGSNRHAVFSDMMAFIGPREAKCLKDFLEGFSFTKDNDWLDPALPWRGSASLTISQAFTHFVGETPISRDRWPQVRSNLLSGECGWPVRATTWRLPGKNESDESVWLNQHNPWFQEFQTEIEILERSRVFKISRIDIPVMGPATWVDVVELTSLGADFYAACVGVKQKIK
ncbi:hypothetical protein [Qipengyuania nanhaisediminis]|uniref:hypothetical protein n=1 Tax=Qipengyuania nanhaisediminis TaxID=604088 RepID=UPI0038B35D66